MSSLGFEGLIPADDQRQHHGKWSDSSYIALARGLCRLAVLGDKLAVWTVRGGRSPLLVRLSRFPESPCAEVGLTLPPPPIVHEPYLPKYLATIPGNELTPAADATAFNTMVTDEVLNANDITVVAQKPVAYRHHN